MFSSKFTNVRPAYEIPEDDLIGQVLIPAMSTCDAARIGVGFFTSRCLAQIAPGLATFVNETDNTLELMISPEITKEDRDAIRRGTTEPKTVLKETIERLFEEAKLSDAAVERHAAETLAFLVATCRLQVRVVLMERGMYHKKIWLFRSGQDWLAVHGSGNATERGMLVNGEQMAIDRAWVDGRQSEARVQIFLKHWERQWCNQNSTSLTVKVDQALEVLRGYAGSTPPTISDFWECWHRDNEAGLEPRLPPGYHTAPVGHRLTIPDKIVWREGHFAHQGSAVDALLNQGGGILAIATGGGKTLTALIAASKMQIGTPKHLCVVILAPTRPLIKQWITDVRAFGIDPIVLSGMIATKRLAELERASVAFNSTQPRTEVFLLTHNLFSQSDSALRAWIESLPANVDRLLIADEVHNLGSPTFIGSPPSFFEHRIGLSATPIRQYDPDGTDRLFDFFGGEPVFNFSLGDAIKAGCLVPYSYHVHEARFTSEEMDHYEDLTEQLARAGFRINDDGRTVGLTPRVEQLLRDRRALVEQADAKLAALERELVRIGPASISKTLVYASAKPVVAGKPRQITAVNRMLQKHSIVSHQYTAEETGSSLSQSILDRFGSGDYQVLTSMRVLDEGVNIPQTDTAFILASSTVEREWIQRRGRILRTAPDKTMAHLHDFVVVPPGVVSPAAKTLLKSELRRAYAFADLAENEHDPDGPSNAIRNLERGLWTIEHD